MSHKQNDRFYESKKEAEEECDRDLLGNDPRYGCRCRNCIESKFAEAEYKSEE